MSILDIHCEVCLFFFFKQKTAYEMRISDWSSDVCSSDLAERVHGAADVGVVVAIETVDRLDHRRRLLPGVGRVEIHQRLAVDLAPQQGEIPAHARPVDSRVGAALRWCGARLAHCPSSSAARDRKSTRLNSRHQCASRMTSPDT